jgi:hypothetical protein
MLFTQNGNSLFIIPKSRITDIRITDKFIIEKKSHYTYYQLNIRSRYLEVHHYLYSHKIPKHHWDVYKNPIDPYHKGLYQS